MNRKKTAGMSLGIVIVFITLMSVVVLALLVASQSAHRTAMVLPQQDAFFFSAEAAMNRAVPGVVTELITAPAAATLTARNSMVGYAQGQVADFFTANPDIFSTETPLTIGFLIQTRLSNNVPTEGAAFRNDIRTAINTFLNDPTVIDLPGVHAPVAGVLPFTSGDEDIFWLIEGTDTQAPHVAYEMGAPAFANLERVPGTSTVYVGWPTDGIIVQPPEAVSGAPVGFQRYRIVINVAPYITVKSYSGAVEMSENIIIPFAPFWIYIDVEVDSMAVFASEGAHWGCVGYCFLSNGLTLVVPPTPPFTPLVPPWAPFAFPPALTPPLHNVMAACAAGCTHRVGNIHPGDSVHWSCSAATCTSGISGDPIVNPPHYPFSALPGNHTMHRILYMGGPPPQNQPIPPLGTVSSARRSRIRNISDETDPDDGSCLPPPIGFGRTAITTSPSIEIGFSPSTGGLLYRASTGRIYRNGIVDSTNFVTGSDTAVHVRLNTGAVTLIGDWSGVHIFNANTSGGSGQALTLGSASQPFVVRNLGMASRTYISTPQYMIVNVIDGFIMEWVSVSAGSGTIRFNSPGLATATRRISIGAEFVAQNVNGTIRASCWSGCDATCPVYITGVQRPQFSAWQNQSMSILSVNNAPVPMGALFHNNGGSHIRVNIENGGAYFHGMFFGHASSAGSRITGHANMHMPPNWPTMPMINELEDWLNSLGSSGTVSAIVGTGGDTGLIVSGIGRLP